jgi:hypothetical protein
MAPIAWLNESDQPSISSFFSNHFGYAIFFDFACKTAIHFKDEARVAQELRYAAGSDPKMHAKVQPALNSLRKHGLI